VLQKLKGVQELTERFFKKLDTFVIFYDKKEDLVDPNEMRTVVGAIIEPE